MAEPRYGHFNDLVRLSVLILEEKINIGEFEESLNQMLSVVREGFSEFKKIDLAQPLREKVKAHLEEAEEGLSLFEQGIQKMRLFVDHRERKFLVEGLKMVQEASDKLNKVIEEGDNFNNFLTNS